MPRPPRPRALATRLAHVGRSMPPVANAPVAPPLYQSTAGRFASLDQLEAILAGDESGYFYYRYGTPNHALLERIVADLEGAPAAVAAASGMAALSATLFALLAAGDHVLVDRHSYGGTYALVTSELPRLGIAAAFVDLDAPDALAAAVQPRTRLLLLETLTNPTLRVTDLPRLAAAAHERGLLVCVDNTFTTPCLIQPLAHGADLVWHSTSKYFGGQSQVLGGVVAGPENLVARIRETVIHLGVAGGAFDTWLAAQGLATLALRVERASASALTVARHLEEHSAVARVHYPGLPSHPQHALAERLYPHGHGGMLSFELTGGEAAARAFLAGLRLIEFVPSLADVTTTVTYPLATSHRGLPPEALAAMGVGPGLVRLSIGIEAVADVLADLDAALAGG
ncbi:MAG TPA: PLP-dependent transferase [Chloroflexota bacterium]|nr:PLP-dependent transferase [Chloroflexota bacterium]